MLLPVLIVAAVYDGEALAKPTATPENAMVITAKNANMTAYTFLNTNIAMK